MDTLYNKDQYMNPNYKFIINSMITEYDIKSANISILFSKNLITKDQYDYYSSLDKKERTVQVGWLLRDNKEINIGLEEGFRYYRELLFNTNNINQDMILNIRKDGVYLINKYLDHTRYDYVYWNLSNIFTSYYYINKSLQFFFKYNQIDPSNTEIVIKGLKQDSLIPHKDFFLNLLIEIFTNAQTMYIVDLVTWFSNVYNRFLNNDYPYQYYREFNPLSKFRYIKGSYLSDECCEEYKPYIDISVNRFILETIFKYFSQLYTKTKK